MMQDISEEEEVAALRKLLKSGPRTNRARPVELADADPPAQAPPAGDALAKGSRLAELLSTHDGIDEAEPLMRQELAQLASSGGRSASPTRSGLTAWTAVRHPRSRGAGRRASRTSGSSRWRMGP